MGLRQSTLLLWLMQLQPTRTKSTITPAAASTLTADVAETPVTFTVSAMDASDNSLTTGNTFMVTLAERTAPPAPVKAKAKFAGELNL